MRKVALTILFVVVSASVSHADTMDCSTFTGQSVANVNTAGGCLLGSLLLNNFQVQGFNLTAAVFVAGTSGFTIEWATVIGSATQVQDIHFSYEVTAQNGLLVNSVDLTSSGNSLSSVLENVCSLGVDLGSGTCTGILLGSLSAFGNVSTPITTPLSPPTSDIFLWKDIGTQPGGLLSGFGQSYTVDTPVPEPGTLALFGTGLLGIAGLLRRKLTRH